MIGTMPDLNPTLEAKYQRLRAILADMGGVVIGMSGGVDSVLLASVACEVLGDRALAITADSPSLPRRELKEAEELAQRIGIRHRAIKTEEVKDPHYAANPVNRCYYCKSELFTQLDQLAHEMGFRWVTYGENFDDGGDHRPGSVAAGEHGVRAPLKEAGLTKAEIRALAQQLELPVWDKPAFACLASRFPYGSKITPEKLAQVEAAEDLLWDLGIRQFRVRHHGDIARIEVEREQMPKLLDHADWIVEKYRQIGFTFVAMDLAGYRRGSMNQGIVTVIPVDDVRVL